MQRIMIALLFLTTASLARAQQAGQFGAGVLLGSPTGATGKYWFDNTKAVDFGAGAATNGGAALYVDFLWHGFDILPQPKRGKLGLYVSAGPRLRVDDDTQFGIRTLAGLSYWIARHPIELFAEAGSVFELSGASGVDADGGAGIRFYFTGGSR